MKKSAFDALKWLLLENPLFLSLSKKEYHVSPLLGKFSLACSLKKKSSFFRSFVLPFYKTAHFSFLWNILFPFFSLMHMDIESACMWLTLETSLRCCRVLFGKWSSMLTFLSKKKLSHSPLYACCAQSGHFLPFLFLTI